MLDVKFDISDSEKLLDNEEYNLPISSIQCLPRKGEFVRLKYFFKIENYSDFDGFLFEVIRVFHETPSLTRIVVEPREMIKNFMIRKIVRNQ